MSRDDSNGDNSDILNSSFYSSTSINTLDHAKTFRNSLVFADLSEPYYSAPLPESQSSEDVECDATYPKRLVRDRETVTSKMSTSPSLSALAGILNEKSRQANEKLRSSTVIDSPIIEGDSSDDNDSQGGIGYTAEKVDVPITGESSPNLFELNDNEDVYCPGVTPSSASYLSTQPDFLSTPRMTEENHQADRPTKGSQAAQRAEPRRVISEAPNVDARMGKNALSMPQRTVSAGTAVDQVSHSKKKKNFFSFLKRRHTGDNLGTNSTSPKLPNSTTFSLGSTRPTQIPPEKLTKKSYSSNNLFSTFRKNKEVKHGIEDRRLNTDETRQSFEEARPIARKREGQEILNKPLPKKDISTRKPTPLSYEHLNEVQSNLATKVPEVEEEQQNPIQEEEASLPLPPKLDSGEAVFPKSLDKQEVNSIVSLERSRSTKSNKRSSVASHRRSFTDTLSVNAQNEGMYVMEASSIVLSTPDLGKSPASSILRNGKFDSADFSSNNSNMQDDQIDVHTSPSDKPPLKLDTTDNQRLMGSIEEKLNDFLIDEESESVPIKKNIESIKLDEDPEFMSDIMEFASIINFGDGVNFDFDSTSLGPNAATLEPLTASSREIPPKDVGQLEAQNELAAGLGISTNSGKIVTSENEHENGLSVNAPVEVKDDEFENEDFNDLYENPQETPRLKAYIPEIDINRPISMSFRGLKAPSFNASITGSSATDSFARPDRMSFASAEVRPVNNVIFSSKIILYDTYSEEEYDRKPDVATCNQLTPQLAQLIKAELNELKSDMEVHEESRCYTHFF